VGFYATSDGVKTLLPFTLLYLDFINYKKQEKKNLKQRPYLKAVEIFNVWMDEIDSFDENVQKRLRKIEKNWGRFTAF